MLSGDISVLQNENCISQNIDLISPDLTFLCVASSPQSDFHFSFLDPDDSLFPSKSH